MHLAEIVGTNEQGHGVAMTVQTCLSGQCELLSSLHLLDVRLNAVHAALLLCPVVLIAPRGSLNFWDKGGVSAANEAT